MRPEILAVCGDAGGAAAVAPVVEWLRADGRVNVAAAAYRQAGELWSRQGLACERVTDSLADRDLAEMCVRRDAFLLGTSVNGVDYERRLAALFPDRSVAVLDFWSNYAARFRLAGGELVQPARICVMDDRARLGMVAEGFDAERLVVTGQPAFDALARLRSGLTPARRQALRSDAGVGPDERLVLFASQPLAEFYARPGLRDRHPGYDQRAALRMLMGELERYARDTGERIVLHVRPHPREDPGTLAWAEAEQGPLRIRMDGSGDRHLAALASDLVCGMTSMMLVEACHLGCLVLSIQPGLSGPDLLPTNPGGFSRLVRCADELGRALREWLPAGPARGEQMRRLESFLPDGQASRRVAAVIYSILSDGKVG